MGCLHEGELGVDKDKIFSGSYPFERWGNVWTCEKNNIIVERRSTKQSDYEYLTINCLEKRRVGV